MSLYTTNLIAGTNQAETTASDVNALQTDILNAGVVGSITLNAGSGGTGAYAVNAESSPNMNVRVTQGVAYVTATPTGSTSQLLRVYGSTYTDLTINANATGSTRYDWVYISVSPSLAANPDANKTTVSTLVVSRSTSNTADNGTPPTYGLNLGIVTVANGASSITNSNITDTRVVVGAPALISNPYKFSVSKAAEQSTVATGNTITYDTTIFDTNKNFASNTYTAPIGGYYSFYTAAYISSSTTFAYVGFSKNGTPYRIGQAVSDSSNSDIIATNSAFMFLAAGDAITTYLGFSGGGTRAVQGSTGVGTPCTVFEGFLVSSI
jgi:C1q domain